MAKRHHALPAREAAPWLLLAGLAATGVLVHGYHFGIEDQAVYLAAIKKNLNPSLYPFDTDFFLLQTRLGGYTSAVAWSARLTRLPVDWTIFLWHLGSLYLLLLGCWRVAVRCLGTAAGCWGGLLLITTLLTLPVAGSALLVVDQYLHPRTLCTGLLLLALVAVLDGRLSALVWILLAGLAHPTLALFGAWHVLVQAWPVPPDSPAPATSLTAGGFAVAMLAAPVSLLSRWFGDPASPAWREAVYGRRYLFPLQWTWYELLGAVAPMAILLGLARVARKRGLQQLDRVCSRLAFSGSVGVATALLIGAVPGLLPLIPLEPMRTLHLIYLFLLLFGGALAGEVLLQKRKWPAFLALGPLALGMFAVQRAQFHASPHVEWPGASARNVWVEVFDWVRLHTPRDALFAMNPSYMQLPGEDEHGFRGLAERGQLAEATKDRAVARNLPALAYAWRAQVHGQQGIDDFDLSRLRDLRRRFGATWLLLQRNAGRAAALPELDCPYENSAVRVCRAP